MLAEKSPLSPNKVVCELIVGYRKKYFANDHMLRTAFILKPYLTSTDTILSYDIEFDSTAYRYPQTKANPVEYRYKIELDTYDVWALINYLANVFPTIRWLLGNIVVRINDGNQVIVIPCNKRSRQIREYGIPVSDPMVITLDESIERYSPSTSHLHANQTIGRQIIH